MHDGNSMQLYVHEAGSHDAPAIVFLHGGGLSGRMWQPQWERLPDYYCLVPDLPEQGRSVQITPFALDDAAQRVATLIHARCANRRAHLVGLSLGGAVAPTVLRLTPDLVDHVVVSGTAAGLGRMLSTLSKANARLYRYLNVEMLIKLSIKQFGIRAEYQAMFREDVLRDTSEAFIRHYTDALMTMRLPTHTAAPRWLPSGSVKHGWRSR
jgi:pimeloyl-ACP methyl ester carboxylesterase